MRSGQAIPLEDAARLTGPSAFNIMLKPAGSLCNLNCAYCYYLDKAEIYGGKEPRMTLEVLEQVTRAYIQANDVPEVQFVWHGGEPLVMGLDFFRKAVDFQRRYADGKTVFNSIQTNGTLLNADWARFFRENNFLVGLSLDGPQDIHDRYRLDRGGAPTFSRVMAGLKQLQDKGVEFNTLSTVSRAGEGRGAEVYQFLKETGSRYMQFLPVVEFVKLKGRKARPQIVEPGTAGATPAFWSVSALGFGQFLCDVFDTWVRRDVGQYYVQLFDSTLSAWCGQREGVCVFGKTCQGNAVIEHNGDLYACDHFVYPRYRLGNVLQTPIRELMAQPAVADFAYRKWTTLPRRCQQCPYLPACHGECPQHRDPKTGVNVLCEGYRMFFDHAAPVFDRMRQLLLQGRAPAEVMRP
ncbi:MAG: anaerobic sulfatase maturase [Bacteroidales bacterium]|nr:anaerobic sulfatase maturase [Bacteroidales bacterium]